KIDVEPVFGFLKANLGFTRMSVRGKPKVHNEMGFALMAVNLRKYTAINNENETFSHKNKRKNGCVYLLLINTTVFVYLGLVMSQPQLSQCSVEPFVIKLMQRSRHRFVHLSIVS